MLLYTIRECDQRRTYTIDKSTNNG